MTLDEWCAQLPEFHLVNEELTVLREDLKRLSRFATTIAITHPHLIPWETEITHEEFHE